MSSDDLTLEVLKGIRAELTALRSDVNERIGQTNERLDQTNERLDRLGRRQQETEVRLATELAEVVSAVGQVQDLLRSNLTLRDQVSDHEKRIALLEAHRVQ
jgi:uncharacterized protein YoxC